MISWDAVLKQAADIVNSYDTGVTLRQLFYRLVALQLIPNKRHVYGQLSHLTAQRRRSGVFPDFIDETRQIHRYATWDNPEDALRDARDCYRLDRTIGQEVSLYLAVEKRGMLAQLQSWFGDLGIPLLPLGGYAPQTYAKKIIQDVQRQNRPAILVYAGDFDPSGEDIDRDFLNQTAACEWQKVERIALSHEQVEAYGLPVSVGKADDTRAKGFVEKHGALMQVELDALPPEELRRLYQSAVDQYWDADKYESVLEDEALGRNWLDALTEDDT